MINWKLAAKQTSFQLHFTHCLRFLQSPNCMAGVTEEVDGFIDKFHFLPLIPVKTMQFISVISYDQRLEDASKEGDNNGQG